jgi:excisionase family DNA binding protein
MKNDRQLSGHAHRPQPTDRLLTKAEAAERLNVSPRFLERCVTQRRIRFVRVGRFIRVPESAIEELVAAGTVTASEAGVSLAVRRR